eukprot:3169993-Prymnesium_polylepis.1
MIEKVTFSVGSNDIETITGEQMQIMNELMKSDENRLGANQVLKTGKMPMSSLTSNSLQNTAFGNGQFAAAIGVSKSTNTAALYALDNLKADGSTAADAASSVVDFSDGY